MNAKPLAVVAVGGNALIRDDHHVSIPDQYEAVVETSGHLADMIEAGWSPSVRLFEAGACATPIISDTWPGLDDLFEPGSEIILAATTEDVIAALSHDAAAMGARARQTVLAHHSAERRAEQLEGDLEQASLRNAQPQKETYAQQL